MSEEINIAGLDKAEVLAALYNNSQPLGMGFLQFEPGPLPIEEARDLLRDHVYFDYLKGRVMKVSLATNELDPWLYDRDNGKGAALRALQPLLEQVKV